MSFTTGATVRLMRHYEAALRTIAEGAIGTVKGVTGAQVVVDFKGDIRGSWGIDPADLVVIPTDQPILARLLKLGDIRVEDGLYNGLTHDDTWCTLPGSVERPDQTEAYLRDFPTPGHW
jgi:hypothetical protein